MYSPKIRDELIPQIYRAAQTAGIPMTTWVNQVIEKALSDMSEQKPTGGGQEPGSAPVPHTRRIHDEHESTVR